MVPAPLQIGLRFQYLNHLHNYPEEKKLYNFFCMCNSKLSTMPSECEL